jgi:hypothetical protein
MVRAMHMRRALDDWERKRTGRLRWLLDVPGSPTIPALAVALSLVAYEGFGLQTTGRQKAGTAVAGWVVFGGFGTFIVWFAVWTVLVFVRLALLGCAVALGVIWVMYAPSCYAWQHRKARAEAAAS